MDKLFTVYDSAKRKAIQGDFIDKLHSRFTVSLLLVIIFLVVSKQYDGSAISCWLPTQFSGAQESYVHQFCWINNTYSYPLEEDADKFSDSYKYVIRYYQFILFILSGQVLLFYLPSVLWSIVASDSGSYINKLLEQCKRDKVFESEIKNCEANLRKVNHEQSECETHSLLISPKYMQQFKSDFESLTHRNAKMVEEACSDTSKTKKNKFESFKKKFFGKIRPIKGAENLAFYYFSLKFFNLFNVLAQIFCLRFIFGADFYKYGIDFLERLYHNEYPMFLSKQFPIMAICDYYIHQNLGKIHWNSSQCLLAINILIEKFFVIIWFWLYILFFLTLFNIVSWFLEIVPSQKNGFLKKYLSIKEKMNSKSRINSGKNSQLSAEINLIEIDGFQKKYLGNDGLIMMHMIKSVAGDLIFIELLNQLWLDYSKKQQSLESTESKTKIRIEPEIE